MFTFLQPNTAKWLNLDFNESLYGLLKLTSSSCGRKAQPAGMKKYDKQEHPSNIFTSDWFEHDIGSNLNSLNRIPSRTVHICFTPVNVSAPPSSLL